MLPRVPLPPWEGGVGRRRKDEGGGGGGGRRHRRRGGPGRRRRQRGRRQGRGEEEQEELSLCIPGVQGRGGGGEPARGPAVLPQGFSRLDAGSMCSPARLLQHRRLLPGSATGQPRSPLLIGSTTLPQRVSALPTDCSELGRGLGHRRTHDNACPLSGDSGPDKTTPSAGYCAKQAAPILRTFEGEPIPGRSWSLDPCSPLSRAWWLCASCPTPSPVPGALSKPGTLLRALTREGTFPFSAGRFPPQHILGKTFKHTHKCQDLAREHPQSQHPYSSISVCFSGFITCAHYPPLYSPTWVHPPPPSMPFTVMCEFQSQLAMDQQ